MTSALAFRLAWSGLWATVAIAVFVRYWRMERSERIARENRFRETMRKWGAWISWRDRLIEAENMTEGTA